jgi:hypothetical protein
MEQLRRQLADTQAERDGFRTERDCIMSERDRFRQQLVASSQANATVQHLYTNIAVDDMNVLLLCGAH